MLPPRARRARQGVEAASSQDTNCVPTGELALLAADEDVRAITDDTRGTAQLVQHPATPTHQIGNPYTLPAAL
jgi:hypothetical protein